MRGLKGSGAGKGLPLLLTVAVFCGGLTGCFASAPNENGIYRVEQQYYKQRTALRETSIENLARKMKAVVSGELPGERDIYYSIIPDKNYFADNPQDEPFDYERMLEILQRDLPDYDYIHLFPALTLEDYYQTDLHWRQEKLQGVVDALGETMGFSIDLDGWDRQSYDSFTGSYGKLASGTVEPETLSYLTSEATENAVMDHYQNPDIHHVYDTAKLDSDSPYEVFLSGPSPFLTIEGEVGNGRKLLIFGDSFSSSLAPLLLETYSYITVVDLRFLDSSLLGDFLSDEGEDVLFLYSALVANNSEMLKVQLAKPDSGS